MRNLNSILAVALLLLGPICAHAVPIEIGDREWRQLSDTQGYSWYRLASICDRITGECSGSIGNTDFSGWTWASVWDVGDLFASLAPHRGGLAVLRESRSQWAPDFFDLFSPTMTTARHGDFVSGWTRTATSRRRAALARVFNAPGLRLDQINNAVTADMGRVHHARGAWLYRTVSVPEPGTTLLMGLGLAGLAASRRRSRGSATKA